MGQLSIDLRPRKLSEVSGQPTVVKALQKRVLSKAWPRAMLFEGMTGTGKTTVAQIVAMTINCSRPLPNGDPCQECSSCRSIIEERFDGGTIRLNGQASSKGELVDFVALADMSSLYAKNTIFIIEEADGLSKQAKESMLKALEAPGKNTFFLLLSMVNNGLGKAIQDRCQKYYFYPMGVKDLMMSVRDVMKKANLWDQPEIPKTFYTEVIPLICDYARGSIRSAIQTVENCLDADLYTASQVKESLKIMGQDEVFQTLLNALNIKKEFFLSLEDLDLNEFFNISYSSLAEGAIFKITGVSKSDYFQTQNEMISAHPNMTDLLKVYDACYASGPYLKKSFFLSQMVSYYLSHVPRAVTKRIIE